MLEHVPSDGLDDGALRHGGDDVREVIDCAFYMRKGFCNRPRKHPIAAADIHEGPQSMEGGLAVGSHYLGNDAGVAGHGIVEQEVEVGVRSGPVPDRHAAGHFGGGGGLLAPVPGAEKLKRRQYAGVEQADDKGGEAGEAAPEEELGAGSEGVGVDVWMDGEEARVGEEAQEAAEGGGLGGGDGEGGDQKGEWEGLAVGVDGIGDAELHGTLEEHGDGVAIDVVADVCLSLQELLCLLHLLWHATSWALSP